MLATRTIIGLSSLAKGAAMAASAFQFNIHEAKTQLSRLVERVEHGEEIIISRAGQPVAKLVPLGRQARRAARGSLRGQLVLSADWDSTETNREIAQEFGLDG